MAISVDWATKIVTVPKADTTLVSAGPPEIRDYDVFAKLWTELKAIEDDEVGIPFVDTQSHILPTTLGGVTFSDGVRIINGFTVTFEAGAYQVNCKGANHNVLDVGNMNATALRSSNSAGLITAGSGVTAQDKIDIAETLLDRPAAIEGFSPRQMWRLISAVLFGKAAGLATTTATYRDIADTKDRITATVDADGNRTVVTRDAT